jgi:hypothetical protein
MHDYFEGHDDYLDASGPTEQFWLEAENSFNKGTADAARGEHDDEEEAVWRDEEHDGDDEMGSVVSSSAPSGSYHGGQDNDDGAEAN